MGAEMWVTDGTASGTHPVKDIRPGPASAISPAYFFMPYVNMIHPISLDGQRLIFLAQDNPVAPQFWSTDGTNAGTYKISMIDSAGYGLYMKWWMNSAEPNYWHVHNGKLFTIITRSDTGGTALWQLDGTPGGNTLIKQLHAFDSLIGPGIHVSNHPFGTVGSKFVFGGPSPLGVELWVSDGTSSGTLLLRDIAIGAGGSYPRHFTPFNGKLLFSAADSNGFHQTWITDGTTSGTFPLATFTTSWNTPPIYLGAEASRHFTQVGLNAYFVAFTPSAGWEVWTTNGTQSGTHMIAEVRPGPATGLPQCLTSFDDNLFLIANTQAADLSILRYDAAADSFIALQSSASALHARATFIVKANDTVLFIDCNPQTGIGFEPHALYATPPTNVAALGNREESPSVWPNPARKQLFVHPTTLPSTITLMDAMGKIVYQRKQKVEIQEINVEQLPPGVYTLKIQAGDANAKLTKVIVY